jgi:hypothetical protein
MTDSAGAGRVLYRRKKYRRGRPNKLPEPLAPVDGVEWGPAMAALPSDRHRAFVLALYQIKPGYGAHVAAAKAGGFGSSTTSVKSWSTIASRLAHDERILAAMHEEDQRRIRSSAPRAIMALSNLIEDPDHKDHARGIGMVLDRVHPAETRHTVDVVHHVDHTAEAVQHLRLLKSLEVPHEKLVEVFGFSGLGRYEKLLQLEDARKETIEGTATEIKQESNG